MFGALPFVLEFSVELARGDALWLPFTLEPLFCDAQPEKRRKNATSITNAALDCVPVLRLVLCPMFNYPLCLCFLCT